MESCSECVYARYPKIPPSVTLETDIAIVGEAPGAQEIAMKSPFIGPSGQVLNKVLAAAGLPVRDKIFVTNALLCKPPPKKPQLKSAIGRCQGRLIEELQLIQPKVIIALGNIAMHSLTGNFDLKITKEQGRVLESPYLPNTKIIPVLHPAAILRAPGDYKLFYGAMHYAGKIYNGDEVSNPGQTEWKVIESEDDYQHMLKVLSTKKIVGADIETTGLNFRRDDILVLGIAYEKNKVFVVSPEFIRRDLFLVQGLQWVWQNGKFDSHFLRRRGLPAKVHHDTMLQSYALNEQGGIHDLEQLSTRLLGAPTYKHKAQKLAGKKGFANLPLRDLYERVATDADYTLQICHILLPKVESNPLLKKLYYEVLIPSSAFLRRVERNGIYVYRPLLQELKKEYQQHLDEIQDKILDVAQPLWNPKRYLEETGMKSAPEVFNPGSTYQVAWLLYDVLRLRPRGRMKGRSTDKEALMNMEGMHPLIDLMLEHRSVAKELSTYIIGVEDRIAGDDRVHTTFKVHRTATGRLSSTQPNVQNQPKRKPRVRNIFQAPEGKKLLEADYKGAELRVLAWRSDDDFLKQCFIEGRDLHTEVSEALGIPRIRAKAVNFGIPYGRTEYSLSDELEISVEEARQYIADWFERAPKAKIFMDWCARSVVEGRTLTTPLGRHRRFGLVTSETVDELQNEARNFIIQSVASDLTLTSAMRAEKELEALGVKIINLVHDSILVECMDNEFVIRRAAQILDNTMRQVPKEILGTDVPFDVEFCVGKEWGKLEEMEVV